MFRLRSLDDCRSPVFADGHHGLFWHSIEQPSIPGILYTFPLVLFGFDRRSRVHHLQEENFQPRGQDQCSVESCSRSRWTCQDPKSGGYSARSTTSSMKIAHASNRQLHCCGYYSPFVEAVASNTCYPRSILPGCNSQYLKFERRAMKAWYIAAFSLVPPQIGLIVAALLCSNHVTYRLGKGIMPKQYRLDEASTAQLLNQYAA
jgi:hypothetical protein